MSFVQQHTLFLSSGTVRCCMLPLPFSEITAASSPAQPIMPIYLRVYRHLPITTRNAPSFLAFLPLQFYESFSQMDRSHRRFPRSSGSSILVIQMLFSALPWDRMITVPVRNCRPEASSSSLQYRARLSPADP